MKQVEFKGKVYDVLHKTTLLQQSLYFGENHIKHEYLVAHEGWLYFADIINEVVRSVTKVSSRAAKNAAQRMVRDQRTDEFIQCFELNRQRARKLRLLIDED